MAEIDERIQEEFIFQHRFEMHVIGEESGKKIKPR
jgi:predicted metal-dependent hydrolase